ncbi:MAG: carbamoyltransferase HypF [Aigarchaeota archaeon]|nr:carbamoyltransferase HypF [Aigarchaeota archaeon]MCX8192611.1 carbamoyltransferase HypF [Nitrososphaeria archaeon]MDW7985653.1 carbamoyltransferase HypF [Nitrososphaerota archaeon]
MLRAVKIVVVGIVQGVGFRPFIYRIASRSRVNGYVKNVSGSAVEIHVEGGDEDIENFLRAFNEEKPSAAYVESFQIVEVPPQGYRGFEILESDLQTHRSSIIPPDISICEDCLREVLDPSSRFYLYPFHSCAYCGPRYSMIENIPYDRNNTSMKDFPLCSKCISEYKDPENIRRFHAQGISCPECGPKVTLYTRDYEYVDEGYNALKYSGKLIDEGYIIAVKGIGGYHIATSATLDDVIIRLRSRKKRPSKPFAVMVLDLETASKIVQLNNSAIELLQSKERPIVLLEIREDSRVSSLVAPSLKHLGIFLPYTSLHYLLLNNISDKFAIMTSGNPKDEPMCTDEECARKKLSEFVDYFLVHNRKIINRVDDSVVRFTRGRVMILRRGRGYAPNWVKLPIKLEKPVIAFGAMLQSAGAVGFDDKAVLTQYIGDVDEYHCFRDLEYYLNLLIKNYRIDLKSSIIAADAHPRYPSTLLAEEWAKKRSIKLFKIQHHWAHIASVMAEYCLDEEVVGVAIDGLGYGLDGTLWGGEIMRTKYYEFERVGHLELQPMPGGEYAVRYPSRMLAGILSKVFSENEILKLFRRLGITWRGFKKGEEELKMTLRQVNSSPKTSSLGRVLDAASALLGVCFERTYEGEPAIKLEAFSNECNELLDVKIRNLGEYILDTTSIILEAIELLEDGVNKSKIGYIIQKSLGYGLGIIASKVAKREHRYLVLSGGAAVNEYIVAGIEEAIKDSGLKVLVPRSYPANDGGIALGQLIIAGHLSKQEM